MDTGCTSTLVNEKFAKSNQGKTGNATRWKTSSGYFETTAKSKVQFTLPELHEQRIITHEVHVTRNQMGYDMIIGMDLLTQLKIDILNSSQSILWDTAEIPMRSREATLEDAYYIADPKSVSQATTRMTEILDAKYDKADIKQVTEECPELSSHEKQELMKLLLQYEKMFDGTLGKWKGTPYNIHLKDDTNPFHGKPYKLPYVYEKKLRVEIHCLCQIGVLRKVNHSEWAAPCFIIPKKDQTIRFISDFRELNKRIKRYPFPLPSIQDLLLKLEGF